MVNSKEQIEASLQIIKEQNEMNKRTNEANLKIHDQKAAYINKAINLGFITVGSLLALAIATLVRCIF